MDIPVGMTMLVQGFLQCCMTQSTRQVGNAHTLRVFSCNKASLMT